MPGVAQPMPSWWCRRSAALKFRFFTDRQRRRQHLRFCSARRLHITHPKVSCIALPAMPAVFDGRKSLRKFAHLGWCVAEIKARPLLYFHAGLFGSRCRGWASGIRTCFAKPALRDDSSATKLHEMRHFLKPHACSSRRAAVCMRLLADVARSR